MAIRIDEILVGVPPDAKRRISAVLEEQKKRVRKAVGDAMRLSSGGRGIRVSLVDGTPRVLREEIFHDELGALLTAHRHTLQAGADCMTLLKEIPSRTTGAALEAYLQGFSPQGVEDLRGFLWDLLAKVDEADVIQRILEVDDDVLGTYTSLNDDGRIEIHWALIALCAPGLGVSMEALALKVLAHEYAHALSHLGTDADGQSWDAQHYRAADRYIHEGLANYFSARALEELRMEDAVRALEAMWPKQPPPYGEFRVWIRDFGASPEVVRGALRAIRKMPRANREDFHRLLEVYRNG
jgi:hypothetical protein